MFVSAVVFAVGRCAGTETNGVAGPWAPVSSQRDTVWCCTCPSTSWRPPPPLRAPRAMLGAPRTLSRWPHQEKQWGRKDGVPVPTVVTPVPTDARALGLMEAEGDLPHKTVSPLCPHRPGSLVGDSTGTSVPHQH